MLGELGEALRGKGVEEGVVFASEGGERGEMLDDIRLKLFLEQRQQFFANACAEARGVLIRGIFAPGLLLSPEEFAEIGAVDLQQGSDDVIRFGMNGGEAGETSAAKDVSKYGFGLVVSGVRRDHVVNDSLATEFFEEGVACAAGGVFEIGFFAAGSCGNVGMAQVNGKAEAFGEGDDEALVGVGRLAAKLVIEVDGAWDDTELFAKVDKEEEQSGGVSAT